MSNDKIERANEVSDSIGDGTATATRWRERHKLVEDAHTLRDGFLEAVEQLRRAALLTPETVKAICEREGFVGRHDSFSIGSPDILSPLRIVVSPAPIFGINAWRFAIQTPGKYDYHTFVTVGQLEDAIAAAKGTQC